jgi:hypothetical protein
MRPKADHPRSSRFVLSMALLSACGTTTPDSFDGTVELFFRPEVGVHYFQCDKAYSIGAASVNPADFRFYVFDVRLVSADGSEHAVELEHAPPFQEAGLALLDFEDAMGGCVGGSSALNKTIRGTVVDWQDTGAVDYTGVRFRLGLPLDGALPAWVEGLTGGMFFAAWSTANTGVLLGNNECSAGCAGPSRPEIALDGFDVAASTIVVDWGTLVNPQASTGCDAAGACGCDSPCVPGRPIHWSSGGGGAVFRLE